MKSDGTHRPGGSTQRGKLVVINGGGAPDPLTTSFEAYQKAFNLAVASPCVRNWRAAVEAADRLVKVCAR